MENTELKEVIHNEDNTPNASKALSSFLSIWIVDEPIGIKIIPSGWTDPRMYHVLVEWGDREETDYHFLSGEQIKERMDIDVKELDFVSYIVTPEDIRETPNDFELGNKIRLKFNKNE